MKPIADAPADRRAQTRPRREALSPTTLSGAAAVCAIAAAFVHGVSDIDAAPLAAAFSAAVVAAVVSVALAVPMAVALARRRFEGRAMLFVVLLLASATSPALLYHASAVPPDFFTRVALGVPLAAWVVYLAARALPAHVEDAARLDGASSLTIWAPLLRPAVAAATALLFLYFSFDLNLP